MLRLDSAVFDENGMLKRDLAEDWMHLNAAGYALMNKIAAEKCAAGKS